MGHSQSIEEILGRRLLLGEAIARNSRLIPNREAVVYGRKRFTYKQFNARINQLAHALLALKIRKGTKVAILLHNCNEFLEAYFALAKIGAVGVPLNFRLGAEEIKYIVNHSDSEALILGEAFVQNIKGIQKELPRVKTYISVSEKPVEGMLHFESWIAGYPDSEPLILVEEDDPAFIMYTAGTTGRPKGAVLSHKNAIVHWLLMAAFMRSEPGMAEIFDFTDSFKSFAAPPVFHLAAWAYCQFV